MSTKSWRGGHRRTLCIAVIVAVAGLVMPVTAMAAGTNPVSPHRLNLIERLAQDTAATVDATTARGGAVDGRFEFDRFVRRQGQLVALGTFRGTVQDPRLGARIERVAQPVAIPLNQLDPAAVAPAPLCHVGQIRLDGTLLIELLGLHLTLRALQLDIQADPTSLLGGILCALVRPSAP